MHIGFLTPEYATNDKPDGGLANYVQKIAHALTKIGYQASVFVSSNHLADWQDGDVTIHEVPGISNSVWIKRYPGIRTIYPTTAQIITARRLAKRVWQCQTKSQIDIIQASSYKAPGLAILNNHRIPVVCRVSSYTPLLRSAYGIQRSLGEYLLDRLEVRQVIGSDAAFTPSQFMAEVYLKQEGFKPEVIHTPIDLNNIVEDKSFYETYLSGAPYLLYFGTLSRIKGIDLLREVIPPICKEKPDIKFVFIGRDDCLPDGTKAFSYIHDGCTGYEERLFYHPAISKPKLRPVIAHAIGVLMPSRIDNYPNACLEAQIIGVPVIGADQSSLEEIIIDGVTGFLAQNGSAKSLINAIHRLLNQSPDEREYMRKNILSSVEIARKEDRLGMLIEFYQQVIANFHRGQSNG